MPDTYWSSGAVDLYHGDCAEVLREMPAESVHCVVTSPPYWGLRCGIIYLWHTDSLKRDSTGVHVRLIGARRGLNTSTWCKDGRPLRSLRRKVAPKTTSCTGCPSTASLGELWRRCGGQRGGGSVVCRTGCQGEQGRLALTGSVASPPRGRAFTARLSGGPLSVPYGNATGPSASDVTRSLAVGDRSIFITGYPSQSGKCEPIWPT